MIEWAFLAVLIALFYIIWKYLRVKDQVHAEATSLFEEWRKYDLEHEAGRLASLYTEEWKQKEEENIRRDAVEKSHAVIKGRITEHLLPFFPDFSYNPKDARFLGSPVDFIVFDGLDEGDLEKIVFIEVKTGKSGALSPREKMVRRCIEKKSLEYRLIHHVGSDDS
jgi:predicted Holliday junction resolvase-like endonuclease